MKRVLILVGFAALAACSRNEPVDDVETGNLGDYEMINEALPEPLNAPAATPANAVVAEPEPAPDPLAEQEQIQEDADATGMTARLPSDEEETAPATNAAE